MSPEKYVYLDYAATTPLDARVLAAMQPFWSDRFGNPSSLHQAGQVAEAAVEASRRTIAGLLGCAPEEVVFTSGGTESDNLAVRGAALAEAQSRGADHILISPVEHHAVLRTAEDLAAHHGFQLELLPVDAFGRVDPNEVRRRLRPTTAVVSVIYGNNEIGTLNPIDAIGAVCHDAGIPFHSDAVQAAAHLRLDVQRLNVDLLSIGGHKFYGPKGVGALYCREGLPIQPTATGGGQEHGLRPGTHNVPLIVGLAEAFRIAQEAAAASANGTSLRDRLLAHVPEAAEDVRITGHPTERLPNHASFAVRNVDGNHLIAALDRAGFACSTGSACKTGDPEPSDVLTALGLSREWALGSLRLTVGRPTRPEDIEAFLDVFPRLVENVRAIGAGAG
ncbi:MAG TPA: cysteine desulfurase family protein [Anaerolineales bacterium]|nr:cysteine desulfurase family protein [Anaerolineales bacterium]